MKYLKIEDCLNNLSEEEFNKLYEKFVEYFNIKLANSKKDKIKILKEKISESFKFFLEYLNQQDLNYLNNFKNNQTNIKNLKFLILGFVYKIDNKYILPNELFLMFQKKITKNIRKKILYESLNTLITVYPYINGYINLDIFLDILEKHYKIKITKLKLEELIQENKVVVLDNNYLKLKDLVIKKNINKQNNYYLIDLDTSHEYLNTIENFNIKLNIILNDKKLTKEIFYLFLSNSNSLDLVNERLKELDFKENLIHDVENYLNSIRFKVRYWDILGRTIK